MALESICNLKHVPSNLDGKKDAVHLESDEIAEDLEDGEILEDDEEETVEDSEPIPKQSSQESLPPDIQNTNNSPKDRSGLRSATGDRGSRSKKNEERTDSRSKRRKHHKKRRHEAEQDAPTDGKRSRGQSGPGEEGGAEQDREEDDDDEMLFVRGASPSGQSPKHIEQFSSQDFDFDSGDQHSNDEFNQSFAEEGGRRNKHMGKFRGGGDKRGLKDRNVKKRRKDKGGHSSEVRKRENCMFFMQGKCQKGDDCPYKHNGNPQRKLELCKFYLMDCCAKRDKCLYMHSDFPCKFFHTGMKCFSGENCKFSHDPLTDVTRQILLKHIETAPKEILGDFPRLPRDRNGEIKLPETGSEENGAQVAAALQHLKKIPSLFEIKITPPPELSNLLADNGSNEARVDQDEREMQLNQQQQQQRLQNRPRNTRPTGYYLDSSCHPNDGEEEEEEEEEEEDSDNDDFETQLRKRMEAQRLERERKEQAEALKLKEQEAALRQELLKEEELEQARKEKAEAPPSFYKETLDVANEERKKILDYRRSLTDDDDDEDQLVMATQEDEEPEEDTPSKKRDESEEEENEKSLSIPKHLPKKQQELFLRIQQQQAQRAEAEAAAAAANDLGKLNTLDAHESHDDEKQEESWYSSDEDEEGGGACLSDVLKNLPKEQISGETPAGLPSTLTKIIPTPVTSVSLDKLNLSHINISPDLTKLLSSIQSKSEEKSASQSRDPRALRDPRAIKVEPKSPVASSADVDLRMLPPSSSKDMDLRTNISRSLGDTDFRQQGCFGDTDLRNVSLLGLPFKPAPLHVPCTEIDASISSHPPVEFKILPAEVKTPDYSYLKLDISDPQVRNDPRLKKLVTKLELSVSPMSPPPVEVPRSDPRSRSNPQQQQVSNDPRKARMATVAAPTAAPPGIPVNPLTPQIPIGFPPGFSQSALLSMISPQLLGAALLNAANPPNTININRAEGLLGPAPLLMEGGMIPDLNRPGLLVPPAISSQHEADYSGGYRGRRGRGNWEPRGRGRGGRGNWDTRDRSNRRSRYDPDKDDSPRHRSPNRRGYNSPNRDRRYSPSHDSPPPRSHRNYNSPQHRQSFMSPRDDGGSFTPPRTQTSPRNASYSPPRDDSGSFTPPQ